MTTPLYFTHKRSKKWVVRYGFLTVEMYPTHKQLLIERVPLGSRYTKPERVFMSTRGFISIAKETLKRLGYKVIKEKP